MYQQKRTEIEERSYQQARNAIEMRYVHALAHPGERLLTADWLTRQCVRHAQTAMHALVAKREATAVAGLALASLSSTYAGYLVQNVAGMA